MHCVPDIRIRAANQLTVDGRRDYVLYWMIANRRAQWNFALDRAVEWARELKKPLLIFEPLHCGYRWASDRLHRFILDGMAANRRALADHNVAYYPYVEPRPGDGQGLLEALCQRACVVVTDDFPAFFLPRMVAAAAARLDVRCEAVDASGLLPQRSTDHAFPTAYAFRRFLQRELPQHLAIIPQADPLRRAELPPPVAVEAEIMRRWPPPMTRC